MTPPITVHTPLTAVRLWVIFCMLLGGLWGATPVMAAPILLTVGMEEANNWPLEEESQTGALTGFHVELIRAVAHKLGWQVQFKRYPWQRTLMLLRTGELQAVTFVGKSAERDQFAVFLPDNVLHISRTSLFIRRDRRHEITFQPPLQSMMQRWRFGAAQGYYYNDEIIRLIQSGAPVDLTAITQAQLFRMLVRGRFDVAFGAVHALEQAEAESPGIQQQLQKMDGVVLDGKAMYLAFSRKSGAGLAHTFAKAYRAYRRNPAYTRLAKQFGTSDALPQVDEFR